ncbi:MAG: hypothetical protein COW65_15505 [Cytophagales bacterium CG18_big_fil_WC_8_21_14_2_50_42_9]|nr:MAG: hypothetical protein COW65_15505 [Cytophagales bacterium CG18_big_fil_WC_8_21_14_2_50_42_9]
MSALALVVLLILFYQINFAACIYAFSIIISYFNSFVFIVGKTTSIITYYQFTGNNIFIRLILNSLFTSYRFIIK